MIGGYWEFERGLPHCLVKVAYVRLMGDLASGVLLSQIAYWFRPTKSGQSKLKFEYNGKPVLIKRREDWYEECGITLKQYKTALFKLQEKGLVEVSVAKFQGTPITHIWLNVKRLEQLVAGEAIETEGTVQSVPKGPINWSEKDQTTNIVLKIKTESTAESAMTSDTADDVLKKFKAKTTVEGTGVKAMTLLWKKRMSLYAPGYVKDLTQKEIGMLKQVHEKLGEKAIEVLDRVLSDWSEFANKVVELKGDSVYLMPTCGAFLKHYEIGLQLIAEPKKQVVEPVAVIVKPANFGHTDEEKATEEDVAATLKALKALKK